MRVSVLMTKLRTLLWRQLGVVGAVLLLLSGVAFAQAGPVKTLTMSVWQEAWIPLIERFNAEHPNIKIELRIVPFGSYHDSILASIAGGVGPDIMMANPQNVARFIEAGLWLPLDAFVERDGFSFEDYLPGGWAYTRFDGVLYGWPTVLGAPFPTKLLAYHADRFDQYGLPYPNPSSWTFDDFREMARRLTVDTNGDGTADLYGTNEPGFNNFESWVWSNGADVLSADNRTFVLTQGSDGVDSLQFVVDLTRDGFARNGNFNAFAGGRFGMAETNFNQVQQNARAGTIPFNWRLAPMPSGKAGTIVRAGNIPMGINVQSKDVYEEAWTFFKWLVSYEVQEWGTFEKQTIVGPVHRAVVLTPRFIEGDGMPPGLKDVLEGQTRSLPAIPQWDQIQTMIADALDRARKGDANVRTALEAIRGPIDQLLQQ